MPIGEGTGCACVCSQVVEYVAVCGMLRALWVKLTLGVGLCGTQPVVGPLRALSCGAGLKISITIYDHEKMRAVLKRVHGTCCG